MAVCLPSERRGNTINILRTCLWKPRPIVSPTRRLLSRFALRVSSSGFGVQGLGSGVES